MFYSDKVFGDKQPLNGPVARSLAHVRDRLGAAHNPCFRGVVLVCTARAAAIKC